MPTGHARIGTRQPAPGTEALDRYETDPDEAFDGYEGFDDEPSSNGHSRHGAADDRGAFGRLWDYVTDPAPESVSPPRRWVPWLALAFSLFGMGVSVYLTIAHFSSASILACSDQGLINCAKVTTSAQSELFGVLPVAVLGLAYYVVVSVINLPPLWRIHDRRVHLARLVLSVGGMCFVLYLLSAELLIIGNICLWCTSIHIITFILFIITISSVPTMMGIGRRDADEEW